MRKCMCTILGLAFILACAATTGAMAQEKSITWWYEQADPSQQGHIKDGIIDPFNKAHPDYKLSINYRGSELDKQVRVALLSGGGPDIVYTAGPSYVAPMARAGQLLDMGKYAEKYDWNDRVLEVFLEMGKYNGKLYALPKTYETCGLFYNKTLFDKHGWKAPLTLEELEDIADKMLALNIVPFASGNANWRPANEHYVTLVLNSIAGPENVYKALKGEIPWTAEPFVKAITRLNDWWQKGYFGPNYFSLTDEQAFAQMASSEAGMMPTGTWQFQRVTTYFPRNNAECAFVGFPSAADVGDEPVYALGVGSTFSINAKSKVPDGAAEVIDFIFSDDRYAHMNTVWPGEWNTPLADLSNVEMKDALELYTNAMKDLAREVDEGNYGYTTWTFLPPTTNTYLVSGIEEVWLKRATIDQFLKNLNNHFIEEMEDGKVPAIPRR